MYATYCEQLSYGWMSFWSSFLNGYCMSWYMQVIEFISVTPYSWIFSLVPNFTIMNNSEMNLLLSMIMPAG